MGDPLVVVVSHFKVSIRAQKQVLAVVVLLKVLPDNMRAFDALLVVEPQEIGLGQSSIFVRVVLLVDLLDGIFYQLNLLLVS